MTLREKYARMNEKLSAESKLESILQRQELIYRISVLDTMKMLIRSAPEKGKEEAYYHFQLTKMFVKSLLTERKIGMKADEKKLCERDTARLSACEIEEAQTRKICAVNPNVKGEYAAAVNQYLSACVIGWLAFRNTYAEINIMEGNNDE